MGIRGKFSLLLSSCVVLAVCLTTVAIAHFFTGEQTSFLVDYQTNRALVVSHELTQKFDLLYAQVDAVVRNEKKPLESLHEILPSVASLEVWEGEVLIDSLPTQLDVSAPKPGGTRWAFSGMLIVGKTAAVGFVARVGKRSYRLGLMGDWFVDVIRTERGSSVQLVQPDGDILVRSESPETYYQREIFSLMGGQLEGQPRSTRYSDQHGKNVIGTFLRLPTEPATLLTLHTPTATIAAVVQRTYRYTALITVAFLSVTLVLGVMFAASLTKPLRELDSQTREIAQGRFDVPLVKNAARQDEVGSLARSFARMGQDLKKTQADLQHAERLAALGKFSASIAHEIKNPLGGILMNTQLAEQQLDATPVDSAAIKETLGFVREETWRADRILKNLMKFSRQDRPPMRELELCARVRRTLQILKPTLEEAGVTVALHLPNEEVSVRANEDQIQEVLTNLIQNAIYAMQERPTKELSVRMEITDHVKLSIADTGRGMNEEIRKHLFEPFFTTKPIGEGTGLGLSVCHGILKTHGGKIEVESQMDRGTTFHIYLPFYDADMTNAA